MIKKSITLTEQQDEWIKAQMATGHYATDSEIIREAIREKQMRTAELERIRTMLIEGEESGFSSVSRGSLLAEIKTGLKKDGRL